MTEAARAGGAPDPPSPLRIAEAVPPTLLAIARAAWPDEACGFLGGWAPVDGEWQVTRAMAAENRAEDEKQRRFFIEPSEIAAAEREFSRTGTDLIGFFHSHPGGRPCPSRDDIERASGWPGYIHCIIGLTLAEPHGIRWYRTGKDMWSELTTGGEPSP